MVHPHPETAVALGSAFRYHSNALTSQGAACRLTTSGLKRDGAPGLDGRHPALAHRFQLVRFR